MDDKIGLSAASKYAKLVTMPVSSTVPTLDTDYAGQTTAMGMNSVYPSPDSHTTQPATKRPAYRVLVMEDDPHIARLITVNLARAGLESRIAADGKEGIIAFHSQPPHLILLDLMMPGMDGFQVCEKIRAQSQVPIVIMTARLEPIHQMRGFRLGADDYVLKPFDPQLLVARVIAHLRRVYRYDNGHIQRKDAASVISSPAEESIGLSQHDGDAGDKSAKKIEMTCDSRCIDVLAHMPGGWAGCASCNYMGPLEQFPRMHNGHEANKLACPNCGSQGQIKFAVA